MQDPDKGEFPMALIDESRDRTNRRAALGSLPWLAGGAFLAAACNADATPEALETASSALTLDTVDTIAQLKGYPTSGAVNVLGCLQKGDGSGGIFYWDPTSTSSSEVEDTGTIVIPNSGGSNGKWKRLGRTAGNNSVWVGGALNVKWFGAKGDGATDSTTHVTTGTDDGPCFLKAIRALPATGGVIYVPPTSASYLIYAQSGYTAPPESSIGIWINRSNISIVGDGVASQIKAHTTCQTIFFITGDNVELRGLRFDVNTMVAGHKAVSLWSGNALVEDCIFENLDSRVPLSVSVAGISGGGTGGKSNIRIIRNRTYRCNFSLAGGGSSNSVFIVKDNVLVNPYQCGITVVCFGAGSSVRDVIISGNQIDSALDSGIYVGVEDSTSAPAAAERVIISDNIIRSWGLDALGSGSAAGSGILVRYCTTSRDIQIHGNILRGYLVSGQVAGQFGICVVPFDGIQAPLKRLSIQDNQIADAGSGPSIEVCGPVDGASITGNHVRGGGSVKIEKSVSDLIFDDNLIEEVGAAACVLSTITGGFMNGRMCGNIIKNSWANPGAAVILEAISTSSITLMIRNNTFRDDRPTGYKTQVFAIYHNTGGAYMDLWITHNDFRGNMGGGVFYPGTQPSSWIVNNNRGKDI